VVICFYDFIISRFLALLFLRNSIKFPIKIGRKNHDNVPQKPKTMIIPMPRLGVKMNKGIRKKSITTKVIKIIPACPD